MSEPPSSREGVSPAPSTASLGPRLFASRDTVDRIERAALAALPARDRWELPGWVCLADDGGFVGRANTATPVAHAEPAALHDVVTSYSSRALSPRVRWTPQAPADTAAELSTDTWRTWGEVLVMTRPVDGLPAPSPPGTAVNGSAVATAEWGRAYATQYRPGEDAVRLRLAAEAPRPKRYVLAERDGEVAAVGLGALHNGLVGLYDVLTLPEHRRKGVARELVRALLAWGARHDADTAFLQVARDNAPAVALYEQLGFTTAYTYVYCAPV